MMLIFNSELKNQMEPEIQKLMDYFAETSDTFLKQSLDCKNETKYEKPIGDVRSLLNQYIKLLWIMYITKYAMLTQSIIKSLNGYDFLTFTLVGRAIIEHTAVFRYYKKIEITPIIKQFLITGMATEKDILNLVNILDKQLRGDKFNWQAYVNNDFKMPYDRKPSPVKQIEVRDCIKEWEKDNPSIAILYALFCDFAHPNFGSTLLIARVWEDGTGIGGNRGHLTGIELITPPFIGVASVLKEAKRLLNNLLKLQAQIIN
jgi:hypothetical protein